MEVEGEAPAEGSAEGAKVSTSGPRLSRRENYKSSKGFQIRLTPKTHFRGEYFSVWQPMVRSRAWFWSAGRGSGSGGGFLLTLLCPTTARGEGKRMGCKPQRRR